MLSFHVEKKVLCNVSCNCDAKILLGGRKTQRFPSRLVSRVLFVGIRPKAVIIWADESSGAKYKR